MKNSDSITTALNVSSLFGYWISHQGAQGDIAKTREFIASGDHGHYMACANPHSLVVASRDQQFCKALKSADLLIPDGAGILFAARALNLPIKERVAGFEFFQGLSVALAKNGGGRYFFLGSSEHVLGLITQNLNLEFPEITVCGTLSPPYKPEFSAEENAAMVAAINAAQPDVLWVGMTAPKQEKWIYQHRDKLFVPFIAAIGAVFDYYAGTKKRASPVWQRLGLEWLPRILREPGRVWRRMFVSAPVFVYWVLKEKAGKALHEEV